MKKTWRWVLAFVIVLLIGGGLGFAGARFTQQATPPTAEGYTIVAGPTRHKTIKYADRSCGTYSFSNTKGELCVIIHRKNTYTLYKLTTN